MSRKTLPEGLYVSRVNCELVRRSSALITPCLNSASATSWPEGKPARAPRKSVRTGRLATSAEDSILLHKRSVGGNNPCKGAAIELSIYELDATGPEAGNPSKNRPHSIMKSSGSDDGFCPSAISSASSTRFWRQFKP